MSSVLAEIEDKDLVPPLVVIQILAQNQNASLSLVKGYVTRALQREKAGIEQDSALIAQYKVGFRVWGLGSGV